ncbi:glycosyltransferase [Aneurinibacillus sp. Ricciae_BoGa-3]|uniref:glycosyltransferase n=1 Tax=Aneurinibacillus sp. Ricciae_BoGa-3 TaxID=3022697 RepID=UPI0023404798|nr:glycosyltransferase [Aneurinibacillus sp. Ricciae_BoGa-3]WCK56173.1 glycosyltransferase [Aneurinibacillus sp. Ricciae_BoGa-3]
MVQIVWKGSVFDHSGYSRASRECLLALYLKGIKVKLDLIRNSWPHYALSPDQERTFNQMMAANISGQSLYIQHQTPDMWEQKPWPSVGFTYWETSKIPDNWISKCHQMDAVFVSSDHNLHLFRQSGVSVPLFKIRPCLSPLTLDASLMRIPPYVHQLPSFRFLSISTWIERKGFDRLLKAYFEAFSSAEDVVLIIKAIGGHNVEQLVFAESRKYRNPGRVYIDTQFRDESEMDGLYRSCQAFVLASRGEGVGYPFLEAGARGLPVIATGWGGHTDFLNEANSYLIPYQLVPVKPQSYYYGYQPEQMWAEVSIEHLKQAMRRVYENYGEAAAKAAQLKSFIAQTHTYDQVATDIITAANQLIGGKNPSQITSCSISGERLIQRLYELYRKDGSEFVIQLYRELLEIEPNPRDVEYFRHFLAAGHSKMAITGAILHRYKLDFDRSLRMHGKSSQTIHAIFRTFYHSDDTLYVQSLYRQILLREPDEGGLHSHLDYLRWRGDRVSVLLNFLTSPECNALLATANPPWL